MNLGRAFGFVFRDPRWLPKVAIGGLLLLVPILGTLALYGYQGRIVRAVVGGQDEPLPEWSDFGDLLLTGLKIFAATLVWTLPLLLVGALDGLDGDDPSVFWGSLSFVAALATYLLVPIAAARVALTGTIGAGMEYTEVFASLRRGLGNYFIALLMLIPLAVIAVLGIVGLCVGVLFTTFYTVLVSGHLWGQAYRLAQPGDAYAGAAPRL